MRLSNCSQASLGRTSQSWFHAAWFHLGGVLLLLVAVSGGLTARAAADEASAKPEYFPQPDKVQQRIDEVLSRAVSLELTEVTLEKAIGDIERLIEGEEISFQFDRRALEDSGIGLDTPVTGKFRNISLRTALRLLLDEYDLELIRYDDALLITTKDRADTEVIVRVYPVGDLVAIDSAQATGGTLEIGRQTSEPVSNDGGRAPSDADAISADEDSFADNGESKADAQEEAESDEQSAFKKLVELLTGAAGDDASQAKPGMYAPTWSPNSFNDLIDAIQQTVAPTTWNSVGGPASIMPHDSSQTLIVSQTERVHAEVLALLRALRAAKAVAPPGTE